MDGDSLVEVWGALESEGVAAEEQGRVSVQGKSVAGWTGTEWCCWCESDEAKAVMRVLSEGMRWRVGRAAEVLSTLAFVAASMGK